MVPGTGFGACHGGVSWPECQRCDVVLLRCKLTSPAAIAVTGYGTIMRVFLGQGLETLGLATASCLECRLLRRNGNYRES